MEFISISSNGVGYYINPAQIAYLSTKPNAEGLYDIVFSGGEKVPLEWEAMFELGLAIHKANKSTSHEATTLSRWYKYQRLFSQY